MSTRNWSHYRAKIAALSRVRPSDDPELTAARQELKAAKLEEHIRGVAASAPPLTAEQADFIASLIRTSQGQPAPIQSPRERQRQEARADLESLQGRFSRELDSCEVCNVPQRGHYVQQHAFVALSPDETIRTAEHFRPLIAEAEARVEAAA